MSKDPEAFVWRNYVYWRAATDKECANAGATDRESVVAILNDRGELLAIVGDMAIANHLAAQNEVSLLPLH